MNLDHVKLVEFEEVSDLDIENHVELCVQQAEGWGMRPIDRMVLTLAKKLAKAQELADKADELQRGLKGQQLQNGQLKKRLENLEQQQTALLADLDSARAGRQELAEVLAEHTSNEKAQQDTIKSLEAEISRLQEAVDID